MSDLRPIPGDSGEPYVARMIVINDRWLLLAEGDWETAAVEGMKDDGSGYRRLVAVTLPGRINGTDERVTIRLLVDPADALNLAECLAHSAQFATDLPHEA